MPQFAPDDDDDESTDLPAVRDNDRVKRMEEALEGLEEGTVSVTNTFVPFEAFNIESGEHPTDADENPRANALGYNTGVELCVATNFNGDKTLYDGLNGDAEIQVDSDTFIDDITEWN